MVRSRHALELALGRRQIAVRPVHIASFKMCLEFGFDHLLPQFSSAKPVRSFGGMQCRLLTARNAHCAVAPNVFHCPILARTRYYGSLQHRRNQACGIEHTFATAALRGVPLDTAAAVRAARIDRALADHGLRAVRFPRTPPHQPRTSPDLLEGLSWPAHPARTRQGESASLSAAEAPIHCSAVPLIMRSVLGDGEWNSQGRGEPVF
jgi:hypothetical protein